MWPTYPTSPAPYYAGIFQESFSTLVSEYEGRNRKRQIEFRFPRKGFQLEYKAELLTTNWATIHNFFRSVSGGGEEFWFVDFLQRAWTDEYVGRGGPFPIDYACAYDGAVPTDETIEAQNATVSDMILLPTVPAANDAYYFGGLIKFDKLSITISVQGNGDWTIVWEYWDGNSWELLPGIADGTTGFEAAVGSRDVTWTMPNDWVDCELLVDATNLVYLNAYWVRARVSVYNSIVTQPKGTLATYNTHTYDLPSKSTVNDATLITYINGVITAKTFTSGGGGGASDRIAFAAYPTTGYLITVDFWGRYVLKSTMSDSFGDQMASSDLADIQGVTILEA